MVDEEKSLILQGTLAEARAATEKVRQELQKKFFGAAITLSDFTEGFQKGDQIIQVQETLPGRVVVSIEGSDNIRRQVSADFQAVVSTWTAKRRVSPGEVLKDEFFQLSETDVSKGPSRDLRGLLVDSSSAGQNQIKGLESRQTILEGTPLTLNAVQKIPNLRRGENVNIRIQSGGVQLTTQGTADESAYLDAVVHVTTSKTKRALVGKLKDNSTVEVGL